MTLIPLSGVRTNGIEIMPRISNELPLKVADFADVLKRWTAVPNASVISAIARRARQSRATVARTSVETLAPSPQRISRAQYMTASLGKEFTPPVGPCCVATGMLAYRCGTRLAECSASRRGAKPSQVAPPAAENASWRSAWKGQHEQ
jgi:hypothetical protein